MGALSSYTALKAGLILTILGLALYQDLRENKIKNTVTFPAALLGLAVNAAETGTGGIVFSMKGWLVPVMSLMALYIINVLGAGDIKLFAAIGSIMGLKFAVLSFIFSVYAGGVIALVILLKQGALAARMKKILCYIKFTVATGRIVPYTARGDRSSKFIFSAAIVPGTFMQLVLTMLQLKGVTADAGGIVWF